MLQWVPRLGMGRMGMGDWEDAGQGRGLDGEATWGQWRAGRAGGKEQYKDTTFPETLQGG